MLYILLTFLAALIFKLWWDTRAKKSGRIINHNLSAGIDGAIYSASAFVFSDSTIIQAIGVVVFLAGLRWILFDMIFAKINWGTWHFHGTSSAFDRGLVKLGKWHPLVKLIPLVIGALIYLYL